MTATDERLRELARRSASGEPGALAAFYAAAWEAGSIGEAVAHRLLAELPKKYKQQWKRGENGAKEEVEVEGLLLHVGIRWSAERVANSNIHFGHLAVDVWHDVMFGAMHRARRRKHSVLEPGWKAEDVASAVGKLISQSVRQLREADELAWELIREAYDGEASRAFAPAVLTAVREAIYSTQDGRPGAVAWDWDAIELSTQPAKRSMAASIQNVLGRHGLALRRQGSGKWLLIDQTRGGAPVVDVADGLRAGRPGGAP